MRSKDNDNNEVHRTLAKDSVVHHYRIIDKIGAGGMGEIYLAEDTKLKRQVALKFISGTLNQMHFSLFKKEAQSVARLQHPNIITIFEINEHDKRPYISMEHLDGLLLHEYAAAKSLSVEEILDIGIQISSGLAEAHQKGIIHRDLKPGNIMVDKSGTVKILDFGLAVLSESEADVDPERTETSNPFQNSLIGTILYMAPEQLLRQDITPQIDIFALGIILHELITQKHPFKADTVSEMSAKILRDQPEDMSDTRVDVPYDLQRIVTRCLYKNPVKRFQNVLDVSNELEELLQQLKNDIVVNVSNQGRDESIPTLGEESFVLTTELVRKLSVKEPRMIGTKLTYLDNKYPSDDVIFFLHGIGEDQRQFSDALRVLPYRSISLSLYGFNENAHLRIPIELHDHSILLHAVIKDVCSRLKPKNIVLIGYSSGADHILNFMITDLFDDIKIDGVLSLACNIHAEDCIASGKLSELVSGDEDQILTTIKSFGQNYSSLSNWLILHNYIVIIFNKFGVDTDLLSKYAADIYKPFANDNWDQFPVWYKNTLKKVPHVRFIVDTGGSKALDGLLQKHLDENVLGDNFDESKIIRVPESHLELFIPDNLVRYANDFMKLVNND